MVRVSLEWGLYVKGSFALGIELWWFSSIGLHVCLVKASGSWGAISVNPSLCSEPGYRLDLVVFMRFLLFFRFPLFSGALLSCPVLRCSFAFLFSFQTEVYPSSDVSFFGISVHALNHRRRATFS